MAETEFSTKEKNKILKDVLKKTNQYYEEILREQEDSETISSLEDEIKKIK